MSELGIDLSDYQNIVLEDRSRTSMLAGETESLYLRIDRRYRQPGAQELYEGNVFADEPECDNRVACVSSTG